MRHVYLKSFSFVFITTLFGCGGSSSDSPENVEDNSLTEDYSVTANVAGLMGNLTVSANNQSLDIGEDGTFEFPQPFTTGTTVNIAVDDSPFRQNCIIEGANEIAIQSDINVNINCGPLGILNGTVRNYYNGEPLSDIQVSLTAQSGEETINIESTVSDGDGSFTITGIGISDRFVLSAFSSQYGRNSIIVSNDDSNPNIVASPLVLNADNTDTFDSTSAIELEAGGLVVISLPENAFANMDGTPFTGLVSATITVIDPSSDPSIMPGEFLATDPATGDIVGIQSFGAVDYIFLDSEGNPLQLRDTVSALINIPVASGALSQSLLDSMPLYYFDTETGLWEQQGLATLTDQNGIVTYQGEISQLGTWNADLQIESIDINGCIVNETNQPVAGAKVTSTGRDYIGSSTGLSHEAGFFNLTVRTNSEILISATDGNQSGTKIINSGTSILTVEECLVLSEGSVTLELTWGENPVDLDSHLYYPTEDGSEGLLYFVFKEVILGETVIALDVDDVSSFGPEIITIPSFPVPGTYRYVVHHYAGTSNIQDSPARVALNFNGDIEIFSPNEAFGDPSQSYWHVVNFVVAEDGTVSLERVQQFSPVSSGNFDNQTMARLKPLLKQDKPYAK